MFSGAEIGLGLKALKAAFDIAKEVKDLTDATAIRGKVIEMQSLIMEAQTSAIEARESHSTQVGRISELEEEVRYLKARRAELDRYELKDLGWGAYAYMLKSDARNSQPPHWVCAHCFTKGEAFIVQNTWPPGGKGKQGWYCPACHGEVVPSQSSPSWMD